MPRNRGNFLGVFQGLPDPIGRLGDWALAIEIFNWNLTHTTLTFADASQ